MVNLPFKLILGSGSPRRQDILKNAGFTYTVHVTNTDEDFDVNFQREEIPLYLSKKKADAFKPLLKKDEVVLTADTIVWINSQVMNKPSGQKEAYMMLSQLSGNMHEVITGVTLTSLEKQISFHVVTKVYFKDLSPEEIDYYITHYKPFDKAGSYGIQEWIGYIGIEKIEGSFFNVMGLPIKEVYEAILNFND